MPVGKGLSLLVAWIGGQVSAVFFNHGFSLL